VFATVVDRTLAGVTGRQHDELGAEEVQGLRLDDMQDAVLAIGGGLARERPVGAGERRPDCSSGRLWIDGSRRSWTFPTFGTASNWIVSPRSGRIVNQLTSAAPDPRVGR
jgi:hypothetical protein